MSKIRSILLSVTAILLTCFVFLASSNAGTVQLPQTGQTKCYARQGQRLPAQAQGRMARFEQGLHGLNRDFWINIFS